MDKSIQYGRVMPNFDSAYNTATNLSHRSTVHSPMSSSTMFSTFSNRSSSPLFHRNKTPPSRSPRSAPKFNFDLYEMNETNSEYDDYRSPSYRSISPSSSEIIHHHPRHSAPSKSQTLSKLRQINDELCRTLAQSEIADQSQHIPPQHHIHHYPLSQDPYKKYRSRSTSEDHSSSTEMEASPKLHKARVTYKIHIPRRHRQEEQYRKSSRSKLDQGHKSTSDGYSSDDPMTVDLYPTRDHGFIKQTRNHSDNRSPWLVDGTSIRRSSYSGISTSPPQTPKRPYYGDKPIKPHRPNVRIQERHQSPYVSSRIRPSSASLNASDPFRSTTGSFSNNERLWRPTGSIKRPKFIGSHAPPSKARYSPRETSWNPDGNGHKTKNTRSFDPRSESSSSKAREHVWYPPSKYSERSLKPEYDGPSGKRFIDGTESEPVPRRQILSNRTRIRNGDPQLRKRIEKAESKVKSAWEPTVTGLTQSTVKESKPPIPHPVKKATVTTPPKSKVKFVPSEPAALTKKVVTAPPQPTTTTNTDRSSLNDVSRKPMFESTPRNRTFLDENDDSVTDLFENESQTSEQLKKQELPRPPPRVEKVPPQQPRKPSVPEPSKGTKTSMKDGLLIRGSNGENQNPSSASEVNSDNDERSDNQTVQPKARLPPPKIPTTERRASPPKPNIKDDKSVVDDDQDENDQEFARSLDIKKWLDDASKAIVDASKKGNPTIPSTPPRPPPTAKAQTPPRRKQQPPTPPSVSPDHNLYKPPFGPKKKDQKAATPPPTTTTGATDEVDDFFS